MFILYKILYKNKYMLNKQYFLLFFLSMNDFYMKSDYYIISNRVICNIIIKYL